MGSKKTTTRSAVKTDQLAPWDPAAGNLGKVMDISGGLLDKATDAYDKTKDNPLYVGPLNDQWYAADKGLRRVNEADNLGNYWTVNGMKTLNDMATGQGPQLDLGAMYSFDPFKIDTSAERLKNYVSTVAGGAPTYSQIRLRNQIADLGGLGPDYSPETLQNTVAGATAPIMRQFTENVIPSILSKQAMVGGSAGGSASRHQFPLLQAFKDFEDSINNAAAAQGVQMKGLESGTFNTLAGLGGQDTASLRSNLGEDWRTLAGAGASGFGTGVNAENAYTIAGQQAAAEQAQLRDKLKTSLFNDEQTRAFNAAQALPGMEQAWYDLRMDPVNTQLGIGTTMQGWSQAAQDADNAQPWDALSKYGNAVTGANALFGPYAEAFGKTTGTEDSTEVTKTSGGIGSVLKGLAGVAGIASGFGAFGNVGKAASAGLGGFGQGANFNAGLPKLSFTPMSYSPTRY